MTPEIIAFAGQSGRALVDLIRLNDANLAALIAGYNSRPEHDIARSLNRIAIALETMNGLKSEGDQ